MSEYPVVVAAEQLSKMYGQQSVVKSINFNVYQGECCGILGPNGAGKTTTLRMLIGSTPPSGGRLTVLGATIPDQAREMRARIGVVPQQDNLDPDFSVTRNLEIYGSYFGLSQAMLQARIPEILEFASLQHKANALINMLSGGMQRRLSLARALINQPELLVLDEPTTGLDPQARQLIWQRLRRLKNDGLTIILTTHYMEEAERLCDRLIIMDNGKILDQGSPRDLIERYIEPQVVEVHGVDVQQWHDQVGKTAPLRSEQVGDTWFYYGRGQAITQLLQTLENRQALRYLHRPASLEDVFLKLTGRELRDD
ncbi:ATP-binding cassette domain-containing protein [Beggiatoa leptomitoformis]|uniref:ATP-binding cassette domain-containing protein n=1 Tax=Beggiatoa leptomitoformis TaxID=288004 RepID=A0A2N9YGN4_9GAMM|nr:ATP-binding cassette domain-containing protein [Beggiatoa leptomitoformis]ALG68055.1 ATP-binding cassette domain-containing protein [Beggiatoa leptomitoformis]AUI69654.1 ATP-binding cassette domain-containing protein [Beggiatoa leptomitoformis]